MGLGGGFLMTLYKRDEEKAYFLNAREKAPLAVRNEMFKKDESISKRGKNIKKIFNSSNLMEN